MCGTRETSGFLTTLASSCYAGFSARSEVYNACGNSSSPKLKAACKPQNGTTLIVPLIPVSVGHILLPSRLQSLLFSPLLTTGEEAIIGIMARLLLNLHGDLSVSVQSSEVRSPVSLTT